MENVGTINFISSDEELNRGFEWAKNQALAYAHGEGEDLVGKWYEAALPDDRDGAFCIRDVCHQANGAHALGLEKHTKKFSIIYVICTEF